MSSNKKVELKDFAEALQKFSDKSIAQKKKAVILGIQKSLPDLVAASPVDTGYYAQSWDMHITETSAVLGNYAPYASIIENGARPHMCPIAPLLAWAKRVLKSPSQPPDYDSEVWGLARGVQRKIAEQGQAPKHVLENMIPTIIKNIKEELRRV